MSIVPFKDLQKNNCLEHSAESRVRDAEASCSSHSSPSNLEHPVRPTPADTDIEASLPSLTPAIGSRSVRWKAELRRRTLHFAPSWFSVNMGTGIVSTLLHQLPYQFSGLGVLSNVVFVLNVFLFTLFLGVSVARYALWPKVWWAMLYHPQQSLFVGTFSMGFATIVNMLALSCVPAWGQNFAWFVWACWWLDAALSLAICVALPFFQFTRHVHSLDQMTGVWLLPMVTTTVASASGGIVAAVLPPAQARLTIVASYVLMGIGTPLAFLVMALYFLRLALHKIPPAALIVSIFLPIGPCGQGAFGLLQLSSVLRTLSRSTGQALGGTSLYTAQEARTMASAISGVSMVMGLILCGMGFFWLIIAVSIILDMRRCQKLPFNVSWWGFVFPLGTLASAAVSFAKEFDSGGFRIIGTTLSLAVVVLWIVVGFRTVVEAWYGKMFIAPCLGESGEPPKELPGRQY